MTDYKCKKDLNLEVDSGDLMLKFARHCWPIRNHEAPSGRQWHKVFYDAHGITLDRFKSLMAEDS